MAKERHSKMDNIECYELKNEGIHDSQISLKQAKTWLLKNKTKMANKNMYSFECKPLTGNMELNRKYVEIF